MLYRRMSKTRLLATTAVSTALVALFTFISVPMPLINGYINLGDGVILLVAYVLGGVPAMLSAAVGSALADIVLGYAVWAPCTAVIKGLEGLIAGLLLYLIQKLFFNKRALRNAFSVGVFCICAAFMAVGYALATLALFGAEMAVASIIPNLIQGACAVVLAAALALPVAWDKIFK